MFIDARHLAASEIQADLCVIGTGPAGLAVARHVAPSRDVLVLEAGPNADDARSQAEYRGESVGLPYFDLDACRTRRFGGSANCWGGYCRPFESLDFEPRERIPHSGWPIRIEDVWPYYERAHAVCRLGPLNYQYDFWVPERRADGTPFRGRHIAPEIRQKAQFDLEAVREDVGARPNVRVCLNATVTEILLDEAGRTVKAVAVRDPAGVTRTVRASRFVVAAGGIENARLLLASRRVQPGGVGNDRDLVGRFFMEHVDFHTGFFAPADPARFRHQLAWRAAGGTLVRNSLAVAEPIRRREQLLRCFFHVGEQSVERTHGYRSAVHILEQVRHGRRISNLRYHWRNLLWDRRALAAAAAWRLHLSAGDPGATGRPGLLRLRVTAEPTPNPASRVMLAGATDRFGMPRARLDWRIDPADYVHVRRSLALFAEDVRQLGLGRPDVWPHERWPTRGTYHHMGTTRMSADPARGVVDADCRVHGVSNLYIAGSSVFPTAGSGTPTLMIVALALRLADHLEAAAKDDPIAVHAIAGRGGSHGPAPAAPASRRAGGPQTLP